MSRVKRGFKARRRRNRVMSQAKGFFGSRSRLFKVAQVAVMHSMTDAYISRRLRKRDMRSLWITRINAAAKQRDISYSRLMGGLAKSAIGLNRKMLADLAVTDPDGFTAIANMARKAE